MREFRVKGKPGKVFSRRLDILMAHCEHLGLLMGGGWDEKKGTAVFWVVGHPEGCCSRMPVTPRVTEAIRSNVSSAACRLKLVPSWPEKR